MAENCTMQKVSLFFDTEHLSGSFYHLSAVIINWTIKSVIMLPAGDASMETAEIT